MVEAGRPRKRKSPGRPAPRGEVPAPSLVEMARHRRRYCVCFVPHATRFLCTILLSSYNSPMRQTSCYYPISQARKPTLGEGKYLAQGHTARKRGSWNGNLDLSGPGGKRRREDA